MLFKLCTRLHKRTYLYSPSGLEQTSEDTVENRTGENE
ncbi:hypothetical protein SAMN05877753_101149 [Bacillus oleivorans]|uniref:Uncharacterized protein n=1 Tax=Bacillus oleivorans TaxID=1448271 RepID=A0A285CGW3_9BACI|nr:hypothetical protein SAMN05877753_101149 [Bacillus oleivorans]